MQIYPVGLLIFTVVSQVKDDARPMRAQRPAGRAVHVAVRIGGDAQVRTITVAPPTSPPLADDENEQPPVQIPVRLNLNNMVVERENFDRWLFADERPESARWTYLDEILKAKVETAGRTYKLTELQRVKLRTAGRGDIKRFFNQVQDWRADFELKRQSFRTGHAALLQLEPLAERYREGPFGGDSLFTKTLRRINSTHTIDQ